MATVTTSVQKLAREDFSKVVSLTNPEDTPVYSMLKKTEVSSESPFWAAYERPDASAVTSGIDGADAPSPVNTSDTKYRNFTEGFTVSVRVSGRANAQATADGKKELARQVIAGGMAVRDAAEKSFLSAQGSQADNGTVPNRAAGMSAWIASNASHGVGGSTAGYNGTTQLVGAVTNGTNRVITESLWLESVQEAWDNHGKPDVAVMNSALGLKMQTSFTGIATMDHPGSKKELLGAVDFYHTPFGRMAFVMARNAPANTVLNIEKGKFEIGLLRPFAVQELAKSGDYEARQVILDATLISRNEKHSSKLADVTAS